MKRKLKTHHLGLFWLAAVLFCQITTASAESISVGFLTQASTHYTQVIADYEVWLRRVRTPERLCADYLSTYGAVQIFPVFVPNPDINESQLPSLQRLITPAPLSDAFGTTQEFEGDGTLGNRVIDCYPSAEKAQELRQEGELRKNLIQHAVQ